MVEAHPMYIPTKFEENLASSFGEDDENVIVNGWTNDDPSHKLSLLYRTAELKMDFFSLSKNH